MRVAQVVINLIALGKDDWILVLPPWGNIYHWKSTDLGPQTRLPWSLFFDLESFRKLLPVIEFDEYVSDLQIPQIDQVLYLQHYAEGWNNGKWDERWDYRPCIDEPSYRKEENGYYEGWFWNYKDIFSKKFTCLSIQGHSSTLVPILDKIKARSIMIDRAEVILHDTFGDVNYWKIRRSMRFSYDLCQLGDEFRKVNLNSSDELDQTVLSDDWMLIQPKKSPSLGGPYLGAHLRRADFLYGHAKEVPNLKSAANQILDLLSSYNISTVFVASDATNKELLELKDYLKTVDIFMYNPSDAVRRKYKDGGIAIIDQWICAHARYFIGTYESTFSFRIQEEREILGFSPETTFNRFCPISKKDCQQPSRWRIVY